MVQREVKDWEAEEFFAMNKRDNTIFGEFTLAGRDKLILTSPSPF